MSAKHHSNAASTATRTATQLRGMAEYCQDVETKGILLAAARVSDQIARQHKDLATKAKREEEAYAEYIHKASDEAKKKICSDWPKATILDKTAIIAAHVTTPLLHCVVDRINERPAPWNRNFNTPTAQLNAELDYAINELASSIAYQAYRQQKPVSDVIYEFARRVESANHNAIVRKAATDIDDAINQRQEAAA